MGSKDKSKSKSKCTKSDCELDPEGSSLLFVELEEETLSKDEKEKKVKYSGSEFEVLGECTNTEIRSMLLEHDQQKKLDKLQTRLNERFDRLTLSIQRYGETQKGNPDKIMKTLTAVCTAMDSHGFEHTPVSELAGYARLEADCKDD